MKEMNSRRWIVLFLVIAVIIVGGLYFYSKKSTPATQPNYAVNFEKNTSITKTTTGGSNSNQSLDQSLQNIDNKLNSLSNDVNNVNQSSNDNATYQGE